MAISQTLQRIQRGGLYLIAALMPLQWVGFRLGGINISAVDPVVWLLGLAFGVERIASRSLRRIAWPPVPVWLFLIWSGISALASYSGGLGGFARAQGKELFQATEYLFVGYLLFRNIGADRELLRRLIGVAGAGVLLAALWSMFELIQGEKLPIYVGGGFANRNDLACLLAIAAPMGVGLACRTRDPIVQVLGALPAALGLCVITSGGAYIALVVGILVTAACLGRRRLVYVSVAAALVTIMAHGAAFKGQAKLLARSVAPIIRRAPPRQKEQVVALRYRRWQANLQMAAGQPWLGVGPGRYQDQLEQYYGPGLESKEPGRTDVPTIFNIDADEPGTHSWLMVSAAETGFPGLLFLLWMLTYFLGQAVRAGPREGDGEGGPAHEDLAGGLVGAVVSIGILGGFANPMVRGVALVCVFLFAAAEFLAARRGTGADVEAAPLAPGHSSAIIPKPVFSGPKKPEAEPEAPEADA